MQQLSDLHNISHFLRVLLHKALSADTCIASHVQHLELFGGPFQEATYFWKLHLHNTQAADGTMVPIRVRNGACSAGDLL